ncbi:MAG: ACT domain-containing protein [Oscillospiraceae bacterium]|nr:ACT domain-containing protein [Oscillospiraceae bacterium]
MELKKIDGEFSVCKIADISDVNFDSEFCFVGKTDEEISLVCKIEDVPRDAAARDDGWKAFRIQGILDFSLIGILSKISAVLADNNISMFAVSTYNTDYVLTKSENFSRALCALEAAGYRIDN